MSVVGKYYWLVVRCCTTAGRVAVPFRVFGCSAFQTYLKHTRNLWPQYGRYDTFPTLESLFLIDTHEVRILTQTREAMRQIAPHKSTAYAVLGLGGKYETQYPGVCTRYLVQVKGYFFYP